MKILIVDDAPVIRAKLRGCLEKAGHNVEEAEDGRKAFDAAGLNKYDMIICDLNMPVVNGLDFVARLKKEDPGGNKSTPVLMLTTESGDKFRSQAQSIGVRAWLVKPFEEAQLLRIIGKLILI